MRPIFEAREVLSQFGTIPKYIQCLAVSGVDEATISDEWSEVSEERQVKWCSNNTMRFDYTYANTHDAHPMYVLPTEDKYRSTMTRPAPTIADTVWCLNRITRCRSMV